MPLPLTVSCFSKIQIGCTFLVPAHLGSPGKGAIKRVCVCVCVCFHSPNCCRHGRAIARVHLMNADLVSEDCQLSDYADQLGLWVPSTVHIAIAIYCYYSPQKLILIFLLSRVEGWRRLRHYSKSVQSVHKSVYLSGHHEKHTFSRAEIQTWVFSHCSLLCDHCNFAIL